MRLLFHGVITTTGMMVTKLILVALIHGTCVDRQHRVIRCGAIANVRLMMMMCEMARRMRMMPGTRSGMGIVSVDGGGASD